MLSTAFLPHPPSIEPIRVILGPDLEFALRLDHLIEQFDVKSATIKVLAHSGHQNAVRLVRALTALQFHQLDHIFAKFGTDQGLLVLRPASSKPLQEIHHLFFRHGGDIARIENLQPDPFQFMLDRVVLHETLNLDVRFKIYSTVLVLEINVECEYYSFHNIVKFVLYNVCELEQTGQRYLVLSLAIFQLIGQFEHLLLCLLNLALRCMHCILKLSDLSLQLLHLNLHKRGEFSVELVDIFTTELVTLVPLLDVRVFHDFWLGQAFVSLVTADSLLLILAVLCGLVHIDAVGDGRSQVLGSLLFYLDPFCDSRHDIAPSSIFEIFYVFSSHFIDVCVVQEQCCFIE